MKRIIKLFSVLILIGLLISLASCGRKSSESTPELGVDEVGDRVVVYDVEYDFNNKNMDEKIENVLVKVVEIDGYIKESEKEKTKAKYVYKVPTANLNVLLSYLDALDGMLDKSIKTKDITPEYKSIEAAIEAIDERIEAYKEEFKQTSSVRDKIDIDNRIEQLYSKRARYQKQYSTGEDSYSTVTVQYKEKQLKGIARFGDSLLKAVLFILMILAIASPFGLVALIIFLITKKRLKKIEQ